MDELQILLALHAPEAPPGLSAGLQDRGLTVVLARNHVDTWSAIEKLDLDAVLLLPRRQRPNSAQGSPSTSPTTSKELTALLVQRRRYPGTALMVLTDDPVSVALPPPPAPGLSAEATADVIDDFVRRDIDLDELVQRIHLAVARRRHVAYLEHSSTTDFKTGLANARSFQRQCGVEASRAAREEQPLGALAIDIDHFGDFNKDHGFLVGDAVLHLMGQALRKCLRGSDFPARRGGDEFAVLLPNANVDQVRTIADRVLEAVEQAKVSVDTQEVGFSVTIGIAACRPVRPEDHEALLHNADTALRAAKLNGRNRVNTYDGTDDGPDDEPDEEADRTGKDPPPPDPAPPAAKPRKPGPKAKKRTRKPPPPKKPRPPANDDAADDKPDTSPDA
jgi:diguanylate cyclase (GGDEF)-like protein